MRPFAAVISGLGASLLAIVWLADRALVGQAEALQDNRVLRLEEDAGFAAEAVAGELDRVERSLLARAAVAGADAAHLALPPARSAPPPDARPYGGRPRHELVGLLTSHEATRNGLPEAVVARIALGPAPPVSGQERDAVAERLLAGELPVRPDDLPFLAERLGVGDDPRVAELEDRLRGAPRARDLPRAPAFERSFRPDGRISGRTLAGDGRLLSYAMPLERLLAAVPLERGALIAAATEPAGLSRPVDGPRIEGLRLRFVPASDAAVRVAALRLVLWLSAGLALVALTLITRLRHRERRAHARERAFLAGITHELRSPLAALRALGETLASERGDPVEYGTLVAREAERLERLAEQALTLARLDELPTFAPTDPVELVHSAVAVVRARARSWKASLDVKVEGEPGACRWDGEAVHRALLNLLDNAIVHGRRGGRVEAHVRGESSGVRLSVRDDGPGVRRADRDRIFERFGRGAGEGPGTGLGLYLVERVARSHGGRVELETAEGAGSTFSLFLPAEPPALGHPGPP